MPPLDDSPVQEGKPALRHCTVLEHFCEVASPRVKEPPHFSYVASTHTLCCHTDLFALRSTRCRQTTSHGKRRAGGASIHMQQEHDGRVRITQITAGEKGWHPVGLQCP
jgi:hypothetical protein